MTVVLFHHAHNVVFFCREKKIHFLKHLIASWVDLGANSVMANSSWGETSSYPLVRSECCHHFAIFAPLNTPSLSSDKLCFVHDQISALPFPRFSLSQFSLKLFSCSFLFLLLSSLFFLLWLTRRQHYKDIFRMISLTRDKYHLYWFEDFSH